jgi:hypothetical protein
LPEGLPHSVGEDVEGNTAVISITFPPQRGEMGERSKPRGWPRRHPLVLVVNACDSNPDASVAWTFGPAEAIGYLAILAANIRFPYSGEPLPTTEVTRWPNV